MKVSNDAQAVIMRRDGDSFLFLILKRFDKDKKEDHYRLVKGGIKRDESAERAIKREVLEETDIHDIETIEPLCHYSYVGGDVCHEVDVFIILSSTSDRIQISSEEEGGFTIKDASWMLGEDAIKKLTFEDERKLIVAALEKVTK